MTYAVKRKIVLAGLVIVTAWPPVHHGLVRALDLNPWHWFGWSMYTVPPQSLEVYPYSLPDRRALRPAGLSPLSAQALMRVYDDFGRRRLEFGKRLPPTEFARALFRAFPGEDSIEINIRRLGLDRSSAMFVETRRERYEYHRAEMTE